MRTFLLSAITLILVFLGAILMFIRGNSFITPSQIDPLSPTPLPTPVVIEMRYSDTPARVKPSISLECPQGAWINCMPGPNSPDKRCDKDYLDWAEINCPGFMGAAY
ncbi:hypothetical protein CO051_02690 [Candidatus Roizmanbacteria bacterium CG_4_9_14_0_2_um_filter_39_13]|uniref:Uncharacterized protein n=2 Tax=Candidatus Roizmaniibacteriota TaxID=1752723 RepID=A0A2M8F077_9BACT|nr:MAG: hypothetical protein COY15_06020 [Candidatus Roizmanbacteria bacterium CG_4_10_14_0_2_um_filter_39_12]PJC32689.1 MAG: hypothetical protein CO051_02690 [Candidatus Roizmanbacteria bacterium CG_4_9_14_0_2_um_filter_39_13]PJE61798.1 MAG: hypothetical protein COU87_02625 [Candidatus Roizmanbacteria bacterium CG10_big_fil_rev_8_21_14_0_10_39_12]